MSIELKEKYTLRPVSFVAEKSFYSILMLYTIIVGLVLYFQEEYYIDIACVIILFVLYVFRKNAGVFVFSPEGISFKVWGIIPVEMPWKEIAKVRKIRIYSKIHGHETNALRIIGYSKQWYWYLKPSSEPSIILSTDTYDAKELTKAEIYASYYLGQYAVSSPSLAKIMENSGKSLWVNRWKVFSYYFVFLGIGISILLYPLLLVIVKTSSFDNVFNINDYLKAFGLSMGVLVIIILWLLSKKLVKQVVLFERNEYGSVFYEPNDEKTRFRIMTYVYPKGIRLLNAFPEDFTDKISVAPGRPEKEEAFLSIHPGFVEPGEIKHIVAMFQGDWQNSLSLVVTYEIDGKKHKEKVWLVSEREVNSLTEQSE